MALVLTNGKISVGAYRISNRKRIALCVEQRGMLNIFGQQAKGGADGYE